MASCVDIKGQVGLQLGVCRGLLLSGDGRGYRSAVVAAFGDAGPCLGRRHHREEHGQDDEEDRHAVHPKNDEREHAVVDLRGASPVERGPNCLKNEKETTHDLLSWRRRASMA